MNRTCEKATLSQFSYFSLHINRSFALNRTGVNVGKSTYRSVKKLDALGRAENEDNSELKFWEDFLVLCTCVHYNPINGLHWVEKLQLPSSHRSQFPQIYASQYEMAADFLCVRFVSW